jgi:hypothetical protein
VKPKKSKLLLVSMILGILYGFVLISMLVSAFEGGSDSQQLGASIATVILAPHMTVIFIAILMNILGYVMNHRGFGLTGGILYLVGGFLFIPYILFVVLQALLSMIAFAKMKPAISPQ